MTGLGTVKCHNGSVKRKPEGDERWDQELWKSVKGTPWKPDPNRETYRIKTKVVHFDKDDGHGRNEPKEAVGTGKGGRLYIMNRDLATY